MDILCEVIRDMEIIIIITEGIVTEVRLWQE